MIEYRSRVARAAAATRILVWRLRRVHPERYCHCCGGPNLNWIAPSPLWNAVMRDGSINGPWRWHEIICPTCFAQVGQAAGVDSWWRLSAGRIHVELETVTPTGRVWDEDKQLWTQP